MIRTGKYFFTIIIIILFSCLDLSAATVILKSGATIKGTLMDKTDEKIVLQETYTKEVRVIRSDLILSITLEPGEQKIVDQKKSGKIFIKGNILEQIEPTLGLMPGIAYPIGKMGSRIQIGYGGNLFFDLAIPVVPGTFALRFGLTAGALYHGTSKTSASSSVLHFPVNAYAKFQFLTASGVRPYIKIGGGTVPVLIGGKVDIPPSAIAAFGLGYSPNKIPFMEFFIEAGYMMVFEKIRGDFVTGNIGVAYRFGAPAAAGTSPAGNKLNLKLQ
jgi:hypothetical protein